MKKLFFNTIKTLLLIVVILITGKTAAQDNVEAGKGIFTNRCAACHKIDSKMVGPALKDVDKRHKDKWIINFVRHSQQMVQSGDTEAVKVFEANNKTIMPDHPDLTDNDILNVLAYIKDESGKLANAPSVIVPDRYKPYPGESSTMHQIIYLDPPGDHKPVTTADTDFWAMLATSILVLIVLLVLAVKVQEFEIPKKDK